MSQFDEVTIGPCTLYRNDCRDILPHLHGIGLIVTSPPFNAGREYELTEWDTLEEFFAFTRNWVMLSAKTLRAGGWCFIEIQDMHLSPEHPHAAPGQKEQTCMNTHHVITEALEQSGLLFKETVVWHRGRWGGNAARLICAPGSPAILTQHSLCLFARAPGGRAGAYAFPELSARAKALWCRSVWDHIAPEKLEGHPAVMPQLMATGVIQGWSLPPDTILDPFMGSGTVGIAALQCGRSFIGIEKLPRYFDLSCRRIEAAYAQLDLTLPQTWQAPQQLRLTGGTS